jgi:N-acyl-D-glutamate deacylase
MSDTTSTTTYDIVLANGRVIDPETYRDGTFHVGLVDDRIAAVSAEPLQGKEVIDASGLIVAPGFIDTHAHGQNITSSRVQAFDGVTTQLELEAGILPIGEFYDNTTKEGRPTNFGASSGWGFARAVTLNPETAVDGKPVPILDFMFGNMGLDEWVHDLADGDRLEQILDLTEQGLKEGAIGIGCAWGYAPGAGLKELEALWELAAKYGRPTFTHVQNLSMIDPNSSFKNHVELVGLAATTGAQTHVCHLNSTSLHDIPAIRRVVEKAQAAGLPVTTEAYVYGAGNSGIGAAEFNPDDVLQRLGITWGDLTLVKTNKDFTSKEEFVKARDESPGDSVIVHLLHEESNPRDAALLDMSVLYPGAAICTDGLSWVNPDGSFYWGDEWPLRKDLSNHPRAAGNYSRFLRKWVRERQVISWMDAIRRTSLNACLILEESVPALKKKGRIQEGMDADVVVFDPETITDKATFTDPCQISEGMHHVIVHGTFVIRDGNLDTSAMPGRAVRAPIVD